MRALYEPGGRALEYSRLAVNLYAGCPHRCGYCFAADNRFIDKKKFHSDVHPRKGILAAIEKDCKRMEGDPRRILLCFNCDPYPATGTCEDVTRPALEIMEKYHMSAQILTKGGRLAIRDFDILERNDWKFGTTLLLWSEALRWKWEPKAASVDSRLEAIRVAHNRGIRTWVSVEPVVDPHEALWVISNLRDLVDYWKVGKINHRPEIERSIDWKKFLADVRKMLGDRPHLIKHDLLVAAGEESK